MQHITKIILLDDKPIMLDYWTKSLENTLLLEVREGWRKIPCKKRRRIH